MQDRTVETLSYTLVTLSAASGIGVTMLRAAIKTGSLKAKKNGAKLVITREAAKTYIDALPDFEVSEVA